ncbi:hypothetical protein L5515_001685 [Caenorhabditis briggsae]|uniref:Uncharacterized protein n=1 Tax=Caenorhabditis briggsae TaxID=6238 RepID=A0AAE9E268_CAEBR|nr:hypothetical protein L5515_001685 [Caenorhabditis briggsae]
MKQRYNLTDEQFEEEKRIAQKQLKNWEEHRKERVLQIFQSNSEYVSKSSKSDVQHPKMARANTVFNSRGEKVDVEFGRLREFYLYTLAPCKEFVSIRDHTAHDKELTGLRAKQKIILENRKDKQATKNKLTEYERSKSVYEDPIAPRHVKAVKPDQKEAIEDTAPIDKFISNTTDETHKQFPESWYHQSITRTQLKPGKMNYWVGNEEEEDLSVDDDPEGKYTVTVEKIIEVLSGGKVKDSGVMEPVGNTAMTDSVVSLQTRYKKTSDFMKSEIGKENAPGSNTITQDEPTDAPNQITYASTVTANVFKGNRLKRQYTARKDVETFEENRKDYTREAGEETSGI